MVFLGPKSAPKRKNLPKKRKFHVRVTARTGPKKNCCMERKRERVSRETEREREKTRTVSVYAWGGSRGKSPVTPYGEDILRRKRAINVLKNTTSWMRDVEKFEKNG